MRYIGICVIASLFFSTLLPTGQRWTEIDIYIAAGIICIVFYNATVLYFYRKRIQLTASDIMVVVWLVYYIIRTCVGDDYPCRTEFLKVIEIALLYFSLRLSFGNIRIPDTLLILFIVIGGCYEALYGAWQLVEGNSRHPLFLLTGSFQNPGPYSAYLMLGLVVGAAAWQSHGHITVKAKGVKHPTFIPFGKIIFVAMIPMCVILPATWSRAAYFGTAITILWIFRQYYWKHRYALLVILFIAGTTLYLIKRGSADGRMLIWLSSVVTWTETPWFGVGIGGFDNAVAEGISSLYKRGVVLSSAGVAYNAFNLLVKVLIEQGITGILLAVTLVFLAMTKLHKKSKPLFYGMTSLLLFSMFSYPFDMLPYKIIATTVIAWSESAGNGKTYGLCELERVNSSILSCLLVFTAWQTYRFVKEGHEADQSYNLIRGSKASTFIKDYYELLPLEEDNADFLFDFGNTLRESRRYNDSNAILRKGTRCSADPMFHVLMGNNYRDMGRYALAEDSYNKAFATMPNRLYPLYHLMLMHNERGDKAKARNMARMIIEMKPKIESPATRDMKKKAEGIMRNTN